FSVGMLLNKGNGTFSSAGAFSTTWNPDSVAIGDFNGDFKLDLVTASASGDTVSVLLNTSGLKVAPDQAAVTGNEGAQATNSGTFDSAVTLTASLGTVTKNDATGTWSWSYTPPDNTSGPIPLTITARNTAGQPAPPPLHPT